MSFRRSLTSAPARAAMPRKGRARAKRARIYCRSSQISGELRLKRHKEVEVIGSTVQESAQSRRGAGLLERTHMRQARGQRPARKITDRSLVPAKAGRR